MDYFFELIQVALGNRKNLSGPPTEKEWKNLYKKAEEQAVVGLALTGLERLPTIQRPPQYMLLQWIGISEIIRQQNAIIDKAVVHLYESLNDVGVRLFVFKGQTMAHLYPDSGLRQSGDIDFYCYQEDWGKATKWLKENWKVDLNLLSSQKDIEFDYEDVAYEMHKQLSLFTYPKHSRYWEKIVMPEILSHPYMVMLNGYNIPTIAPVYNVLFIFVHIFHHLISDGIGLRQFIDWMLLIESMIWDKEETALLVKHLEGIGLKTAFGGLGAVLTDYLGLEEKKFPLKISKEAHRYAPKLMANIIQLGSFGHNQPYSHASGVMHGIQHLIRILKQARLFGHYAPAETWWKIPQMIQWWGKKMYLMKKCKIKFY